MGMLMHLHRANMHLKATANAAIMEKELIFKALEQCKRTEVLFKHIISCGVKAGHNV